MDENLTGAQHIMNDSLGLLHMLHEKTTNVPLQKCQICLWISKFMNDPFLNYIHLSFAM